MQHQSNRKHTKAFTFMLSLGMLASVLIWAKLRLITDIPRSALADPEDHELLPEGSNQETQMNTQSSQIQAIDGLDELPDTEDSDESVLGSELQDVPLSDP